MLKSVAQNFAIFFSGINFNGALCNRNGGIEEEEPDRRWRRESQSNKLLVIIISIIFFQKKKKKKRGWLVELIFFFFSFLLGLFDFLAREYEEGGKEGRLWSEREEEGSIGTEKKEKMKDDGSVNRIDKFFSAVISLPAKGKEPLSVNLPYLFSWIWILDVRI